MYCDICGEPLKKITWYEEIWGSRRKVTVCECTNDRCDEEEEEEEDDER